MSTRMQIGFYETDTVKRGDKFIKPQALLYKHCDGYPDTDNGVMAWLVPFYNEFMQHRGVDPEYMAAWCMYTMCAEDRKWRAEMAAKNDSMSKYYEKPSFTGFGVCYDHFMHGDIEYYYAVTPKGIRCYHVGTGEVAAEYTKVA